MRIVIVVVVVIVVTLYQNVKVKKKLHCGLEVSIKFCKEFVITLIRLKHSGPTFVC